MSKQLAQSDDTESVQPTAHRPRRFPLPAHRSLVVDLMYFQRNLPSISQSRTMHLGELAAARGRSPQRISWCLLFIKAYSLVGQRFPQLRMTYMNWPWPHVYEHPTSVANLAISRSHGGADWLFFAPLYSPHEQPLHALQQQLEDYRERPIAEVFNMQWRVAHYPLLLRRAFWAARLHLSGRQRIKRLGTFGLTTLAAEGATLLNPRAPLTSVLSYGPQQETGECEVTITYDHRIMDGRLIAAVLKTLESTLREDISRELNSCPAR